MNHLTSSEVRTPDDIEGWLDRLEREWPQRQRLARTIARQVAGLNAPQPRVVELACGSGYLAQALLRTIVGLRYLGFDRSPHLLTYARRSLGMLVGGLDAPREVHLREADLTGDDWLDWLAQTDWYAAVDSVVSLQSMHDLGGADIQARVVSAVARLLRPGGLLIYADLLLDPADPHPRRMTVEQHLTMLEAAGFVDIACIVEIGEFACLVGTRPEKRG